jgi:hypothetical protein
MASLRGLGSGPIEGKLVGVIEVARGPDALAVGADRQQLLGGEDLVEELLAPAPDTRAAAVLGDQRRQVEEAGVVAGVGLVESRGEQKVLPG